MKDAGKCIGRSMPLSMGQEPTFFSTVGLTMRGLIKADRNIGKGLYCPQHLHAFKVFFYWRVLPR